MDAERSAGRVPYYFPVGASVPLGSWGYIRCIGELVEQLGRDSRLDIFCAVSSAGTHAGLVLGKALFGCDNWRVLGVPVSDTAEELAEVVRTLVHETSEVFGLDVSDADTPVQMLDGYIGEGYAVPYPESIATIKLLAEKEGILLDPTYTSKAMTGLLSMILDDGLREGATPVFIHTGGMFGLMARRDLFDVL
jgi:1-aminocyclopropane-1-carboxylate deaminase/D-cysteine desulfhydrase-like pyridoxal-dependent ACC family enzyme